jgi:DNA polymerase
MKELKKIVEFYQDLGVDEILSEETINRFEQKPIILAQEKQKIAPASKSSNMVNNISNMTQVEAIAHLVRKQNSANIDSNVESINDIVTQAQDIVSKVKNLEELEKAVMDFNGCSLKKMATNTVFCDGDPKSDIMIIGEAPGNHEDLQGIPFCGEDGKLLTSMFSAIGQTRDKLYITNTLFWRPPGNRRPTKDELAICKPFVEKHIELVAPKLIVLMGSTAMSGMLGVKDPISQVRGKFLDYQNEFLQKPIKAITLFHPSYLMRQPIKKRVAWKDLKTIEKFLENDK